MRLPKIALGPAPGSAVAIEGAIPTRAAACWLLPVPSSGTSTSTVGETTGPMPGLLRGQAACGKNLLVDGVAVDSRGDEHYVHVGMAGGLGGRDGNGGVFDGV